jgi:hypothetical protein
MHVTVISTGNAAPTKERCIKSVKAQQRVEVDHKYIEASEQAPPRTRLENVIRACCALPPEEIVAWIDGDDWLASEHALARIAEDHRRGAWATYGTYIREDGQWGHAAPVVGDPRKAPWTASHLKTFRAGLVHRLRVRDFMPAGQWATDLAPDVAIMIPVLEMAAERAVFVPELLYVYSYATSWESKASEHEKQLEKTSEAHWRASDPYGRVDNISDACSDASMKVWATT